MRWENGAFRPEGAARIKDAVDPQAILNPGAML